MKPTILIIEDNKIVQKAFQYVLDKKYKIITATNGQEGVEAIKNNRNIELIITDYEMPILNGLELLKWAKQHNSDIPIIVISGKDIEIEALKLGASSFILKPCGLEIIQLIEKQLKKRERG